MTDTLPTSVVVDAIEYEIDQLYLQIFDDIISSLPVGLEDMMEEDDDRLDRIHELQERKKARER